ncbi:RNA polymerase sigma factor [Arundinibacter roseus]|uniref:Sigma-70 family RNA polymerase sigma factor n=1 Tax=Arundinibacter roseus TaxID=2070510 RepID=A0A4R4KRA8_9BACT|nr:sigma-70 family RNA polymerase sigma factor [Arundinibacter roseus]TDB69199.1 sigma-70 family RNA polymerase sigma factor [Arundinibacter roseus]
MKNAPIPPDQLLIQALKGDEMSRSKAIEALFTACTKHRQALSMQFRIDAPDRDSLFEDLFMDSFLTLIENLQKDQFREDARLATYFCGIFRNKARRTIQFFSENPCVSIEEVSDTLAETEPSDLPEETSIALKKLLMKHISQQEPHYREMLHLICIDNLNDSEIDRKMRIYNLPATIRMKKKCLKKLRESIPSSAVIFRELVQ